MLVTRELTIYRFDARLLEKNGTPTELDVKVEEIIVKDSCTANETNTPFRPEPS